VSTTATMSKRLTLYATSLGIVMLQCAVAAGVSLGTYNIACTSSNECPGGFFCETTCLECPRADPNATGGYSNTTWEDYCGLDALQGTYVRVSVAERICDACTNDFGSYIDFNQAILDRISVMSAVEWVTLFLASVVMALGTFAEVRDALLCDAAVADAICKGADDVSRRWRCALEVLSILRLLVFLPFLIFSAVNLVVFRGGGVLEICVNTVAVLFLAKLDNRAFYYGLDEATRMEAEEKGRVPMNRKDSHLVDTIKMICMVTIPAVTVGCPFLILRAGGYSIPALGLCAVPFLLTIAPQFVQGARAGSPMFYWYPLRAGLGLGMLTVVYAAMFYNMIAQRRVDIVGVGGNSLGGDADMLGFGVEALLERRLL